MKLLKTAKKHNTKLLLCFEAQNAGGDVQIGMQCIELNSWRIWLLLLYKIVQDSARQIGMQCIELNSWRIWLLLLYNSSSSIQASHSVMMIGDVGKAIPVALSHYMHDESE